MKESNHEQIVTDNRNSTEPSGFASSLAEIVAKQQAEARYFRRNTRFLRRRTNRVLLGHMFDMLILGVPFCVVMHAGSGDWLPESQFLQWWIADALIAGLGLWRQNRRFSRINCPECSRQLSANEFEEGASIYFRCHDCRIDWETGFVHSTN